MSEPNTNTPMPDLGDRDHPYPLRSRGNMKRKKKSKNDKKTPRHATASGRVDKGKKTKKPALNAVDRIERNNRSMTRKRQSDLQAHIVYESVALRVVEDAPDRGYFLVTEAHWPRIDEHLEANRLEYRIFHASFINDCHRFVRSVQLPTYKAKKDWEVAVYEILRQHPVPVNKYIEALEIFQREVHPSTRHVTGKPIKSERDIEHRTAQLALYSVIFSKDERRAIAEERKETQNLAFASMLDALDGIDVTGAAGPVEEDDDAIEGGVALPNDMLISLQTLSTR